MNRQEAQEIATEIAILKNALETEGLSDRDSHSITLELNAMYEDLTNGWDGDWSTLSWHLYEDPNA